MHQVHLASIQLLGMLVCHFICKAGHKPQLGDMLGALLFLVLSVFTFNELGCHRDQISLVAEDIPKGISR